MTHRLNFLASGLYAESAAAFASQLVQGEEMEDKFYQAVRDSRLSGFRDGMKAALMLFAEVRGRYLT